MELGVLRVLLVRHGLSEDNLNAIWAGHRDSPLTSVGVSQAKALGATLANYSFHAIYTSDLKRASSTAEEILAANRSIPPPPLVQTQSLREQNFGQAEGRNWNDPEFAQVTQGEGARTERFPDGENLEDVNARMSVSLRRYILPRLESLRTGHERNEPQIVIVAHGIAIAEIIRVLISLHDVSDNATWPDPRETYHRVRLENTGWTLVELAVPLAETEVERQRKTIYVRIVQQNITSHLQGMSSATPAAGNRSGNQVGALLAGGAPSATLVDSSAGSLPQPPLAKLNLRTVNSYDARHLMRELERAGTSNSLPTGAGGDNTLGVSSTGIGSSSGVSGTSPSLRPPHANTASSMIASAPGAWSDVWQQICVQILPLFNNEDLRSSIEEVNHLVSDHIRRCLERSPARALDSLSRDLYTVCTAGIYTLNAKLEKVANDDVRLLEGLVDTWKGFHWRILPWIEACFLPLQMDATLISLSCGEDNPTSSLRTESIDVARVALTVFRDQLLLARVEKVFALYLRIDALERVHMTMLANGTSKTRSSDDIDDLGGDSEESRQIYPRLVQMNSVLYGAQTNDENQSAMDGLVRALRVGHDDAMREGRNGSSNIAFGGLAGEAGDLSGLASSSRGAKRAQARQGWLPKSAAKQGVPYAVFDNAPVQTGNREAALGEESAFFSSLRSPTVDQDADDEEDGAAVGRAQPTAVSTDSLGDDSLAQFNIDDSRSTGDIVRDSPISRSGLGDVREGGTVNGLRSKSSSPVQQRRFRSTSNENTERVVEAVSGAADVPLPPPVVNLPPQQQENGEAQPRNVGLGIPLDLR